MHGRSCWDGKWELRFLHCLWFDVFLLLNVFSGAGGFLFEGLSDDEDDFHQVMLMGQVRWFGGWLHLEAQ